MRELLRAMRPRQWTKNLLLFAGLVFDQQLFDAGAAARVSLGFLLACALTSAVYLLNDLADLESDRQHPTKRWRPLAMGSLSPRVAGMAAILLIVMSLSVAYSLLPQLAFVFLLYLLLQLTYTLWLKTIIIVDLIVISIGFVLRVVAGTVIIPISEFSPWLYVCTALLALFLVIGKRWQEQQLLQEAGNPLSKPIRDYSLPFLQDLLRIISTATLIAYLIYTIEVEQATVGGVNLTLLTSIFVLYSLFRYLYLIHDHSLGAAPEDVLFNDRPLQIAILSWGMTHILILYWLADVVSR